jgi:hypothetical protein
MFFPEASRYLAILMNLAVRNRTLNQPHEVVNHSFIDKLAPYLNKLESRFDEDIEYLYNSTSCTTPGSSAEDPHRLPLTNATPIRGKAAHS